jgi:hypothetical protein
MSYHLRLTSYALFLTGLFYFGCSNYKAIDHAKARALVESLIMKIDSGKYQEANALYTDEFNTGEPLANRIAKYAQLKEAMGNVQSMKCTFIRDSTTEDDWHCAVLIYQVKHTLLTSTEQYTVVSQGGNYKVSEQNIKKAEGGN